MIPLSLLHRYNVPAPRYTSYPTVPFWNGLPHPEKWQQTFSERAAQPGGMSLYIHLPFCESLCTYCGCNKKITTNHGVEREYLDAVLKEWNMYRAIMPQKPLIRELHLGGGTPTFFSPAHLETLLHGILDGCDIHPDPSFSFEGHPNNTTAEHLQTLYNLGFRRVSYGVQDHNPQVQHIINRIQPPEKVMEAVQTARAIGYTSVNFDLIYGLPLQTPQSIAGTIRQSITLQPDRIAFYSYAHVPWTSKAQRLFDENDLPDAATKMELYTLGKTLLMEHGYQDIGMDHFALPHDELNLARHNGSLHRNFMGYTTQNTPLLLGLGVSAISDAGIAFVQNHKTLHDYYQSLQAGQLPVAKGYFLDAEDMAMRQYILDLSCQDKTTLQPDHIDLLEEFTLPELRRLEQDGLLTIVKNEITLTNAGKHLLRNVCKAFDQHLWHSGTNDNGPQFSKAV
jgi:oxygen-independent coproporphyrinogen-3 oxidase